MGNAASRATRRRSSQPKTKESPAYLFLEEELQEKIKEHGWFHDSVADVCHRQGELLDAKGSYRDAMDKFLEALDIRKNVFGDTHVVVAETLYGIARALEHQGSHAQAVDFFEEAIDVQELVCGPHSREVGDSKNMMGFSQYKLERNEDALGSLWGALQIREQFEDERGVAETLFNIGLVHQQMGEHRDALGWYEKSLKSALKKGDSKLALQAVEEALPLMTVLHGKSTKTVATLHLQKGVLLDQEGMFEEAMESFNAALEIRQNKLGRFHRSVAEVLYIMGCTHLHQDQLDEARDKFERAAAVQKKKVGMDSKEYGDSKNMLGYTQYKLGKLNDALANLSDALGVRKLLDDADGIAKTMATIKSVQKVARRTQPRRRPQRVQKSWSGSSNRSSRSTERDLSPIREAIVEETEREEHDKPDDGSEFLRDKSTVPVSVSLALPTLNGLSPATEENLVPGETVPVVTPESNIELSSENFEDPSGELTDSERTPDPSSEHADPSLELTDSEGTPDPPAEPTDPALELTDSERTPDPSHEAGDFTEEPQKVEPKETTNQEARSEPTPEPDTESRNHEQPIKETKEATSSLQPETIDSEPTISEPKEIQVEKRMSDLAPETIDSEPNNLPELSAEPPSPQEGPTLSPPTEEPTDGPTPSPTLEEEMAIPELMEKPVEDTETEILEQADDNSNAISVNEAVQPEPAAPASVEAEQPDVIDKNAPKPTDEPTPAPALEEGTATPELMEMPVEDTKTEKIAEQTDDNSNTINVNEAVQPQPAAPVSVETAQPDVTKTETIAEQSDNNNNTTNVNEAVQPEPAAPASVEAAQPDVTETIAERTDDNNNATSVNEAVQPEPVIDQNAAELLSIDFDRDGDALKEALGEDVLAMWVEQDLYQDMPDLRNELLKGIVDIKFQNLRDEQAQLREKLKLSGIPVPQPMAAPAPPPAVLLDC